MFPIMHLTELLREILSDCSSTISPTNLSSPEDRTVTFLTASVRVSTPYHEYTMRLDTASLLTSLGCRTRMLPTRFAKHRDQNTVPMSVTAIQSDFHTFFHVRVAFQRSRKFDPRL